MTKDIQPNIEGWDFEPGTVSVRIVRGLDGRDKVQMRVELGLLQMEMDGRPDGTRPHGHESLLEHYEARAAEHDHAGSKGSFQLVEADCDELLREGVQYYYRYLSFFHLGRYDLADRDTRRNLRLFAFARRYATSDEEKWRFDQYRPYTTMMNTRARATTVYEAKRYREALEIVDEGISGIRQFLVEHELEEQEDQCAEFKFLKRWRDEIDRHRPLDPLDKLQRQLAQAIQSEDFERAAKLRDRIRELGQREPRLP